MLTLLFFHLLGVGLLFAGVGTELASVSLLHRATTVSDVRAAMQPGAFVGIMMGSGALLLIAMGIALVYVGGYGWQPWSITALVIAFVLSLNGPLTNGKRADHIASIAAKAPDGPITGDLRAARADRFWNYSIFMTALELIAMLYVMSSKPDLTYSIAAVVAAALLAIVPAVLLTKR